VTLVEAGSKIGGQFRLAGLVPRRSQITDLLKWYERQLAQLGVRIHLNTFFEDADVESCDADHIVIATGSLPDPKARQRWLPDLGALPGLDLGMVFAPEEVLRRETRLGDTVVVYDEGGNWRGAGTAWYLAEAGKSVILVTPDAFVGKELERTSADAPLRRRLACAGVQVFCEHGIARWHGNRVTLHNFLTQTEHSLPASALVMATTNQSFDIFKEVFDKKTTYRIGDAAAPRQAPYAFYEGRQLGMSL
ncbi:MAG: NAD(P)/FAD-dependent oxidoreductase, partial [Paracoccaceae bacterium]|nr:NAD(P)/FAD-dependent oxidoreductase [Paracoccaceae bacterium]